MHFCVPPACVLRLEPVPRTSSLLRSRTSTTATRRRPSLWPAATPRALSSSPAPIWSPGPHITRNRWLTWTRRLRTCSWKSSAASHRTASLHAAACRAWHATIDANRLLRADLLPLTLDGVFFETSMFSTSRLFSRRSTGRKVTSRLDYLDCPLARADLYWPIMDCCNGLLLLADSDRVVNHSILPPDSGCDSPRRRPPAQPRIATNALIIVILCMIPPCRRTMRCFQSL